MPIPDTSVDTETTTATRRRRRPQWRDRLNQAVGNAAGAIGRWAGGRRGGGGG